MSRGKTVPSTRKHSLSSPSGRSELIVRKKDGNQSAKRRTVLDNHFYRTDPAAHRHGVSFGAAASYAAFCAWRVARACLPADACPERLDRAVDEADELTLDSGHLRLRSRIRRRKFRPWLRRRSCRPVLRKLLILASVEPHTATRSAAVDHRHRSRVRKQHQRLCTSRALECARSRIRRRAEVSRRHADDRRKLGVVEPDALTFLAVVDNRRPSFELLLNERQCAFRTVHHQLPVAPPPLENPPPNPPRPPGDQSLDLPKRFTSFSARSKPSNSSRMSPTTTQPHPFRPLRNRLIATTAATRISAG